MKSKLYLVVLLIFAMACGQVKNQKSENESTGAMEAEVPEFAQKIEIKVSGMTCGGCEKAVQKAIDGFDGVYSSKASYVKGIALIEVDTSKVKISEIEAAIQELGYETKGYVNAGE